MDCRALCSACPQGLAQDHGHAVPLRHRRIVEDDQRFDLLVSGMGLIEDADCFLLGHGGPVQDGLYLSGVLGGFFWLISICRSTEPSSATTVLGSPCCKEAKASASSAVRTLGVTRRSLSAVWV